MFEALSALILSNSHRQALSMLTTAEAAEQSYLFYLDTCIKILEGKRGSFQDAFRCLAFLEDNFCKGQVRNSIRLLAKSVVSQQATLSHCMASVLKLHEWEVDVDSEIDALLWRADHQQLYLDGKMSESACLRLEKVLLSCASMGWRRCYEQVLIGSIWGRKLSALTESTYLHPTDALSFILLLLENLLFIFKSPEGDCDSFERQLDRASFAEVVSRVESLQAIDRISGVDGKQISGIVGDILRLVS